MKFKTYISAIVMAIAVLSSCHNRLDLMPVNDITAEIAYSSPEGYKQSLAKVYGSFAMTGGSGSGSSDIQGIDAGASDFLRLYWNVQEVTSDLAICAWVQDPGVPDLNTMTWTSENVMLMGLYARSLYQITVANEFLRESTDELVASRGITGADAEEIKRYRAEARFLRAYQYWVLMDLFGNPPFVTETSSIGKTPPEQIVRADLFDYIEAELLDIESALATPRQNEYGRADQAAAWLLLARLYLNAEVYTGANKYSEAVTYAANVINSGYSLTSDYRHLFLADNHLVREEIILSINYDAVRTQNFGGTTFLINSSTGGDMDMAAMGIPSGGWGGNRARATLPNKFMDITGGTDRRAMFFGDTREINDVSVFTQGLAVTKFRNVNRDGSTAPSNDGSQVSVDFPLFRLADAYLIYAEAVLRGGNGSAADALNYVNLVRQRAYGGNGGNINAGALTLDFILDERAREFYWEAHRRTDLIRFGRYAGGSYLWPFKGGAQGGTSVPEYRNIFPLPASDVIANPNLEQHEEYK